ncbi:MAG: leucyl-tRNA synthetase [Methanohalophilus sp.]|nr:MAG: leucyl-tRNA synthetase [Methanohalophilus sp.]
MEQNYNPVSIENRWQNIWSQDKVFEPEPDSRHKYFITIPYPYLNGNLHAGHTRTFTIGDVIARHKRMQGYNVLYPMGFHVTGTPIVGLAELIANRDPQTMDVYSNFHPLDIPLIGEESSPRPMKHIKNSSNGNTICFTKRD